MKNIFIFDADGVVIKREMYFSQRLARDLDIPEEKIMNFFRNEYKDCAVGKADLKQVLGKYMKIWEWRESVDNLLKYWFEGEQELNEEIVNEIKSLREKGYICCLATNNESYRTKYLTDKIGLKDLFDFIFSSSEVGHLKSEDEFWKYALERLGVKNIDDVFVWESDDGIVKKVKKLGMKGFLFTDTKEFMEKMSELFKHERIENKKESLHNYFFEYYETEN